MKKKVFIFLLMCVAMDPLSAQTGNTSVGVKMGYEYQDGWSAFYWGAEVNVDLTQAIRLTPSFDYSFYGSGKNTWGVNVDAAYLIPVAQRLSFFPFAGVAYLHAGNNYIGVNVGAGFAYACTDRIDLSLKAKYQIVKEADQLQVGIGIAYKF